MKIMPILKAAPQWLSRNQTVVKAALAVLGVVATGASSGVAAVKSKEEIDKAKKKESRELTNIEKAALVWPYWIGPTVACATTMWCIVSGARVSVKRTAAITALYSGAQQELVDIRGALEEMGSRTYTNVMDRIDEKKMEDHPKSKSEVIITGNGDHLCYDSLSGRYFRTSIEKVRAAQNSINSDVLDSMWVDLNDFYFLIHLCPIDLGDLAGWNHENMLDIIFDSKLTDDGEPCMVISYNVTPKYREW